MRPYRSRWGKPAHRLWSWQWTGFLQDLQDWIPRPLVEEGRGGEGGTEGGRVLWMDKQTGSWMDEETDTSVDGGAGGEKGGKEGWTDRQQEMLSYEMTKVSPIIHSSNIWLSVHLADDPKC